MKTPRRFASVAELATLERLLPAGLTDNMREFAVCLFEALVLTDARAGTTAPMGDWAAQLGGWARQVLAQLQHLAQELGGRGGLYIGKGLVAQLTARNLEMCAKFKNSNYHALAREYDLTEVQVRNIVDAWQRERFAARQGKLPGLDDDSDDTQD